MSTTIRDIASYMRTLKQNNLKPPVLYLGERAALTSDGRSWLEELEFHVLCLPDNPTGKHFTSEELATMLPEARRGQFFHIWERFQPRVRIVLMRTVLSKLSLSPGYTALAQILKDHFFRMVLTGNPDALIQTALNNHGISGYDYYRIVNRTDEDDRAEFVRHRLENGDRQFNIFKVIGDFGDAELQATEIKESQIRNSMAKIQTILAPQLGNNILVTGYGPYDEEILQMFPHTKSNEAIYFIGQEEPYNFTAKLSPRPIDYVTMPNLTFDVALVQLAQELGIVTPPAQPAPSATPTRPAVPTLPVTKPQDTKQYETIIEFEPEPTSTSLPQRPISKEDAPVWFEDPVAEFNINVDVSRNIEFSLSGSRAYRAKEMRPWPDLDIERENREMAALGQQLLESYQRPHGEGTQAHDAWRQLAKAKGQRLLQSLELAHPDLGKKLDSAARDFDESQLTLRFSGPYEHLSIPYELLYLDDTPLAARYPLCRQVTGVTLRHGANFDKFVHLQARERHPLRILLIASNVDGLLAADEEIQEIADTINQQATAIARQLKNFKVEIKLIKTAQATLSAVSNHLNQCNYHIVHFAGHSYFDANAPSKSGLMLRGKGGFLGRTGVDFLTANHMQQLLSQNKTQTQLFFMNSCVGAASGNVEQLKSQDDLGLLDSLVRAGIPYVLGYRWYATDRGSRNFSHLFYQNLFGSQFIPEKSVMQARKHIYMLNPMDETWVSTILVAQHIYI